MLMFKMFLFGLLGVKIEVYTQQFLNLHVLFYYVCRYESHHNCFD